MSDERTDPEYDAVATNGEGEQPMETDEFAVIRDRVGDHVTRFVRDLRRAGAVVPANAGIDATRALAAVGFEDFWRARAALRASLLTRKADVETLDSLFPRFWDELQDALAGAAASTDDTQDENREADEDAEAIAQQTTDGSSEDWDGNRESGAEGTDRATADDVETGATMDPSQRREFGAGDGGDGADRIETSVYSADGQSEPVELQPVTVDDEIEAGVRDLTRAIAERPGRRWTNDDNAARIDTRRALRRSFATGGTVMDMPRRSRTATGVRGVVLVDVSRSVLDTIDRSFLVRFLRTLTDEWRDLRTFFFDTDIREVTEQLGAPSADAAARALEQAEATWGGGTRIGHALTRLRTDAAQSIDRTTAVIVISDGLEMGETDDLEAGMAWLAKRSSMVLWLNPLAAANSYEPTCRGMALSLPYIDGLFAFAGPNDVQEIARQVGLRGAGGSIGYEYDTRRREE